MPVQKTDKIWHNGKWILWDDAKLHVLTHAVSYAGYSNNLKLGSHTFDDYVFGQFTS